MRKISDSELVSGIKAGKPEAQSRMYLQYRDECLAWIRKNFSGIDSEQARDVYTDACVVAWDKISNGAYELRAGVSFKTYLFSIVRNSLLKIVRDEKKKNPFVPMDKLPEDCLYETEDTDRILQKKRIVHDTVFNMMTEPCRSIFRYRYYEEMSSEEIAVRMSYSGARSVISTATRCREKLHSLLSVTFKKHGLL